MDKIVEDLHAWIDAHTDDMVKALQGVLRIRSVEADAEPNAPFGPGCREALDYTLNLCQTLGYTTHDDSGYAGHAEFGAGDEMVAAMGHLDVVPEGDEASWSFPPYGATNVYNKHIYSRGAADDKGPTYAALFGATALLKVGVRLSRRVRVIFGCNEESGFGCVHHYWEVAKNERPVAAFTPDSRFPLIYAEKGIANLVLQRSIPAAACGWKLALFAGGSRPNIVPDSAHAHIIIGNTPMALDTAWARLSKFWDKNVSVEIVGDGLAIHAIGKSAHGARPEGGDNAVARLARAIAWLGVPEWEPMLTWINRSADTAGITLGIAHTDEVAGPLTSNLGIAGMTENGDIKLTYNIRYPVTWSIQPLLDRLAPAVESAEWSLAGHEDQPPLYVPLDQEPVATLLRVYQEETGDMTSMPGTMGGGTYARATPNAVAYGSAFPGGNDGPAHEPDEHIAIDTLVRAAKIYAHALYELAK
jgi:succinyl-diaminopimelate desuccinylase